MGARWRVCVRVCVVCVWLLVVRCSGAPCPPGCQCSLSPPLSVLCKGTSLPATTELLPTHTKRYHYEAYEAKVNLAATNFSHLTSLQVLQLSSPYDHIVLERIITEIREDQQMVFWPLENLQELRININWGLEVALPELFMASEKLEILDLSDTRQLNYINLRETLKGLENSTVFKSLNIHNSQTLEMLLNGFTLNLTDLLDPLKNCPLEEFDFSYNAIRTVVPGLISKAPRLRRIDASNNLIIPLLSSAFFFEVVVHPTIIEADFSEQGLGVAQRSSSNESQLVPASCMHAGAPSPALPHSGIRHSPTASGMRHFPTASGMQPRYAAAYGECLEEVMDDLCNIFRPECADLLQQCTLNHTLFCHLFSFINPLTLFIPCDYFPPAPTLLDPACGGCFVFPLNGHIQRLHLQNINNYDEVLAFPVFKDKTCFNPNNSLALMDFSHNREHGYADIDLSFSTTVQGFNSLAVFNLSYNQMQHPSPDFGSNLPKIDVLDLSYNLLDLQGKYGEFLAGATSVRLLNLAGNMVQSIPYDRFTTLARMHTLNMSHNLLHSFSVDIRNLSSLAIIDLSANRIPSLPPDMTTQLSAQAARLKNRTGQPLTIDLSQNPLLCTCSVRHFTDWVLDKPDNILFLQFDTYTCLNDDSSQVDFHKLKKSSLFDCLSSNVYIGVGVGSGVLLSIIVGAIVTAIYRRRWWIRYHYFIARRMLLEKRKQDEQSRDYRWDAFVSYNHRDEDWVEEVLQPKLEVQNRVRLCLHERDFQYGGLITDLIIESIENSRKTLLILSPHFVASNWCKFEMQMAHQKLFSGGEDVLLMVVLKPLANVEMSATLKALLEQKNYVEWTDDEYGQKLFWAKLMSALNVPEREEGPSDTRTAAREEGHNIIPDDDEERLITAGTRQV